MSARAVTKSQKTNAKKPQRASLSAVPNPNTAAGRAAIIDEYGQLDERIAELKPIEKRHEALRKQILSLYSDADPAATLEPEGSGFTLTIGPSAIRRRIVNMRAIVDKIGLDAFLLICNVSLEKLDGVIIPTDQSGIVVSDRTGPRQLRSVAKPLGAAS